MTVYSHVAGLGTGKKNALSLIAGIFVIWLMDTLVSHRLVDSGAVSGNLARIVDYMEQTSTVLFVAVSIGIVVSIVKPFPRAVFPAAVTYLTFSVVQLIGNVFSMLFSAHLQSGTGLGSLWDVGATYIMSVAVFMFVYVFLDVTTPGGAFVWPSRPGEKPPPPGLVDYLFLSLNTNSTFGPTTEVVISRPAKLIMSIQVLLSILMLTVLISRAISATS